jgi:protein-S-isoprenylcysteine O-methyltransferase Ste14
VPTRRATWLPLAAVVANGLLVGASLDQSIKQLPARHRLGVTASAADLVLQLGVVTGLVPWWLTGWRVRHPAPPRAWAPLRVAGAALLATGAVVPVHAFLRFVVEGVGSPAPIAPTQQPVVGGPYRYVRNPMYLAVVAVIIGQALALGQPGLLAYAAAVGGATAAFAHGYEEPTLCRQFGAQYQAYRRAVPAWWPRRHPWTPGRPPATKRDRCHG